MRYSVTGLLAGIAMLCLSPAHAESGIASWYGPGFYGHKTACGQRYTGAGLTAAHKTLPCGTQVRVTLRNGKHVTVTITDRGPYVRGRIIDLSRDAKTKLLGDAGTAHVTIEVVK